MKRIRSRLTYANVMSSLALFLVLAGGTAFAASQLGKNSVGAKQLKKNAVTTAKIKKNAVTTAKIKKNAVNTAKLKSNAVTTAKIKPGAVTASSINLESTPFGRVMAKLRTPGPAPFGSLAPVALGTYTQPAGETDQFYAGLTVNWAPSCAAPRQAIAFLIRNPPDPNKPEESAISGVGSATDKTGASATSKLEFASFSLGEGGLGSMSSFEPSAPEAQSFYVYLAGIKCASGEGATASNFALNVVGFK